MNLRRFKSHLPLVTLMLSAIIMLMVNFNINWGKDHWNQVIRSDAEGYYAWLPAVFIYHDLSFGFFGQMEVVKYHDPNNFYDYRVIVNDCPVDKYYCGTAICQSPFFFIAHLWAAAGGYDLDGYSKPYPLMMTLAAVFFLMSGLFFLNKWLGLYDTGPVARSLTLAACLFGTNLFYYTIGEPGMSHVFSFAFVCMFLYYTDSFFRTKTAKFMVLPAICLAMIVLIRPVNGLVVLCIPFLAGSWQALRDAFRFNRKNAAWFAVSLLVFLLLISIQGILYKLATGTFFAWSYVNEGFDFSSFNMHSFLVSYKKGFFLYTPLVLFSLSGLWYLNKRSRFAFISWICFMLIILYVLSSWWNWWYGGSFSSRVMVEYLPFFMILLALMFENLKKSWKSIILATLVFLLVAFCQIQTYQYRYYKIHWEDMDKEKYWDVFLKMD